MKKILFYIIFFFLFVQILSAETIRIGYFQLPPLQYFDKETQKPRGATFTYFNAMAAQLNYDVEWIGPLPLLRLSQMLEKGEIDGTLGFNKSPEISTFLYFLDEPLYFAYPIIVVRKDNPLTQIQTIKDIEGYNIGTTVSMSGRYAPLLDNHRDKITMETLGGEIWIEQNLRKLLAGRIDAVFDRQPYSVQFVAEKINIRDQIRLLPLPGPPRAMYIVFSKNSKYGKKFLEQVNAFNPTFKLDYQKLIEQELQFLIKKKKLNETSE